MSKLKRAQSLIGKQIDIGWLGREVIVTVADVFFRKEYPNSTKNSIYLIVKNEFKPDGIEFRYRDRQHKALKAGQSADLG